MVLTDAGQNAVDEWMDIPNHDPNITLDSGVVMPNHIHAIITILYPTPVGAIHELPLRALQSPQQLPHDNDEYRNNDG